MADATPIFNEISGALDNLANQILNTIGDDRSFMEIWGWNMPAISRHDLADQIRHPRDLLQHIDPKSISEADISRLQAMPSRIEYLRNNAVPQLPGGNAYFVVLSISSLIESMDTILEKYHSEIDLKSIEDKKILPRHLVNELKKTEKDIERIKDNASSLSEKLNRLRISHDIAETLPEDLKALNEAKSEYDRTNREATQLIGAIDTAQKELKAAFDHLRQVGIEADNVLDRANKAYSAATTVGLGAAFTDKAKSLRTSVSFFICDTYNNTNRGRNINIFQG